MFGRVVFLSLPSGFNATFQKINQLSFLGLSLSSREETTLERADF